MREKALRQWWQCLCFCCLCRPRVRPFQEARPAPPASGPVAAPPQAPASAAAPPPARRWQILIVEDDLPVAEVVQAALQLEGDPTWETRIARSGEDALAVVAAGQVDLILLDVRLPGINGAEVYRRLRAAPATQRLPIIFLSGGTTFDLSREGIQEGILLRKPFNIPELVAMVWANLPDAASKPDQPADA